MITRIVETQSDLDAALADSDVTTIRICSPAGVPMRLSSSGSATVEACDSATVNASGSANVWAYDSATVCAYDSATVCASGPANVNAYNSTNVCASGPANVNAYGSATVCAYDSTNVCAYGSSTVNASGSTTVTARDSCTITAGPHVAVHLHSTRATVTGGTIIDLTRLDLNDPQTWTEHHGVRVIDGRAVLYKALTDDLTMGAEYGNPTVYAVGAELSCPDWRDDNTCGGGYHLSPSPVQATRYHRSATRWMRCTVALADLRPINDSGAAKCKARTLLVEAEVDAYGRDALRLLAVCTTCGATTDGAAECDRCAIYEETTIKRREDR